MSGRVFCFRVFFCDSICLIALLTKIEIEAIITFIAYVSDRYDTTTIAFDIFLHSLTGLDNKLNAVLILVMTSDPQTLIVSSKITVLAQTKMPAIGANKTGSYNRFHVATHTIVVAMSC